MRLPYDLRQRLDTVGLASKTGGSRVMISQEYQQYELNNNCGEPIDCFVCERKTGKVSRRSGAKRATTRRFAARQRRDVDRNGSARTSTGWR